MYKGNKKDKDYFDDLVRKKYKVMELTKNLTPMQEGWTEPGFVFETQYKEGHNYGIVGGSMHTDVEGNKGKLIFLDFDIKKRIDGVDLIVPEAKKKLAEVLLILKDRKYYSSTTKSGGAHKGILSNEDIPQGVALYKHQDCKDLKVDIRNEKKAMSLLLQLVIPLTISLKLLTE